MEIIERKISEIKPYPKNAKTHDSKQIEKIANSIREFGFNQSIVIDKNGVVIVGHGRLEAAKFLNLETVPTLTVDISEEKAKAYRLSDNKLNESPWEMTLVIEELKELNLAGFNIDLTGFDRDLIIEPEKKDDEIPETPKVARTKLGDIYTLGGVHRVMCGNSTDSAQVAMLMNEKEAELLFTSPPYSDMRNYNDGKDLTVKNLANFVEIFYPFAKYQVINLGIQRKENEIYQYWDEYIKIARYTGYKFLSWNVWNRKTARTIGQQTAFFPLAHEWIFVFGKEFKDINKTKHKASYTLGDMRKEKTRRQKDGTTKYSSVGDTSNPMTEITSVFESEPELSNEVRKTHPATFPVQFPLEYIKAMSVENDIVVEPFLGSGTTLIASQKSGRVCYGMELDCQYVDVAVSRYCKYMGTNSVILNGKEVDWVL